MNEGQTNENIKLGAEFPVTFSQNIFPDVVIYCRRVKPRVARSWGQRFASILALHERDKHKEYKEQGEFHPANGPIITALNEITVVRKKLKGSVPLEYNETEEDLEAELQVLVEDLKNARENEKWYIPAAAENDITELAIEVLSVCFSRAEGHVPSFDESDKMVDLSKMEKEQVIDALDCNDAALAAGILVIKDLQGNPLTKKDSDS